MNVMAPMRDAEMAEPISVAVLATGGQGGGVLVDWIVALAESQGFIAQSTSVPGVAQRTGATIYYVEMIKARADGRYPVLGLMPTPGHVDIAIGAELMEAGRAMQRGLVSPGRTTLIASSHRSYAVQEKIAPGDGIADDGKVYKAAQVAAKRFIACSEDRATCLRAKHAMAGRAAIPVDVLPSGHASFLSMPDAPCALLTYPEASPFPKPGFASSVLSPLRPRLRPELRS